MKKNINLPLVSVVIPTFNLKEIFIKCLATIIDQNYPNLEIIVVDNASSDGTSDAVKEKFPQVKLYRNDQNLGVTGGVNTGLKKARGEYIWLVDHDNFFKKNALRELLAIAESDSLIGIVVPKIYYWDDKSIIWAAGTGMNLLTGENLFRGGKDEGQYDKIEEVEIAPANFLVKKEVFKKVGHYDDIFFVSYEDADFSYRARKAGYKIVYTPKAVCYHKFPLLDKITTKKRWLSRSYWAARNKIIFMKKHSPYFLLFVLLYPLWIAIYTYQSFRYNNIKALVGFYQGMISGYKWVLFK